MGGTPPVVAGHHVLGEHTTWDLPAFQGLLKPGSHIVLSSPKLEYLSQGGTPLRALEPLFWTMVLRGLIILL